MPGPRTLKLVWSPAARNDLIRLRDFIRQHNPDAARRAAEALKKAASLLFDHPGIGTRVVDREDRELFVSFRSVALALMIPVGCSCRRQDSRNGDNLVVPRFAPLRTAAPPRAAPGGALGLRTGPTRMA